MNRSQRWTELTSDPNSAVAKSARLNAIRAAQTGRVNDRMDRLALLAANKKVLEIGCAGHQVAGHWPAAVMRSLRGRASEYVGADINGPAIASLREQGLDVEHAGVGSHEALRARGPFEVLIAGELIEHLGCIESLFSAARDLLSSKGVLVLTTPNPFSLDLALPYIAGRRVPDNVDHVCYVHVSGLIELAERHGFVLKSIVGERRHHGRRRYPVHVCALAVSALFRHSFADCKTMIYELEYED